MSQRTFDMLKEIKTGLTLNDDYDWIPGRILRCFFDKGLRSDTVEQIFCTSLFPPKISVKVKVKTWVKLFSKFDKSGGKCFRENAGAKTKVTIGVAKVSFTYKDGDGSELQKIVALVFCVMSHWFTDPKQAEPEFFLLHQLIDANVWEILTIPTLILFKLGNIGKNCLK